MDIVAAFEKERSVAIERLCAQLPANAVPCCLVDGSEQPAQSQEVIRELGRIFARRKFPGRKAVVVSSVLQKQQVARLNETEGARVFTSRAKAMDWLTEKDMERN